MHWLKFISTSLLLLSSTATALRSYDGTQRLETRAERLTARGNDLIARGEYLISLGERLFSGEEEASSFKAHTKTKPKRANKYGSLKTRGRGGRGGSSKKSDPTIKDYAADLPDAGPTCQWDTGAGKWARCHGDDKSKSGGVFHAETMNGSDGKFHARVVGSGGSVAWSKTWDKQPSAADVAAAIKKENK